MAGTSLDTAMVLRALDANGDPVSGALLTVYVAGTTTTVTTFADENLTTPNPSPVVADSSGAFGPIYVPNGSYKVFITDPNTVVLPGYPVDDLVIGLSDSGQAARFGDTPTRDEYTSLNVPAVAQTLVTSGFSTPGDGGGGLYVQRSVAPSHSGFFTTANGLIYELVPEHGGFNILQFGADPTGASDASSKLQDAVDALPDTGGRIIIPPGIWLWNSQVEIAKHNVMLDCVADYGRDAGVGIGGSWLKLGATLNSGNDAMIKVTYVPDSQGQPTTFPSRGFAVRGGLGIFGDDRAFECKAGIWLHAAGICRVDGVTGKDLNGSLIYIERMVRGFVGRIEAAMCGKLNHATVHCKDANTGDPAGSKIVQGSSFYGLHLETNHDNGLYVGTGNSANKFDSLTFETTTQGGPSHMVVATERCLFSNITSNRHQSNTAAKVVVSGNRNTFTNLLDVGDSNETSPKPRLDVQGNNNEFTGFSSIGGSASVHAADQCVSISGRGNAFNSSRMNSMGGWTISGNDNSVFGAVWGASNDTELNVTGLRVSVQGHRSRLSILASGNVVSWQGENGTYKDSRIDFPSTTGMAVDVTVGGVEVDGLRIDSAAGDGIDFASSTGSLTNSMFRSITGTPVTQTGGELDVLSANWADGSRLDNSTFP